MKNTMRKVLAYELGRPPTDQDIAHRVSVNEEIHVLSGGKRVDVRRAIEGSLWNGWLLPFMRSK